MGHYTQVAVIDVEGIDEKRGRARGSQRGCNLGSDVSAFANASHDNLALAVEHQVDCFIEILIDFRQKVQ